MAKNPDASNRKGFSTWSEITHDVLYLIMMQLGVVDFVTFSGVCKSWRALALSNKNNFMESKPPMSIWIHRHGAFRKDCCYLEDSIDGRKTKITLPHSADRTLVGLTCGYLVFFRKKTRDFWLLNPITRHGLHFPGFPICLKDTPGMTRAILVFLPSMSGWVLVVAPKISRNIWFSIAGKGKRTWNHFTSGESIMDLHAFKGKIYIITSNGKIYTTTFMCQEREIKLNPQPKETILEIKNPEALGLFWGWEIVSSGENLYVMDRYKRDGYDVWELDTAEMELAPPKHKIGYAYYVNSVMHSAYAIALPDHLPVYTRYVDSYNKIRKDVSAKIWYFPHDCFRVDILHES